MCGEEERRRLCKNFSEHCLSVNLDSLLSYEIIFEEICVNIKICHRQEKWSEETPHMLQQMYDERGMCREKLFFLRHSWFKQGRESVQDNQREDTFWKDYWKPFIEIISMNITVSSIFWIPSCVVDRNWYWWHAQSSS